MNARAQAVADEIELHRTRFERWCRSLSEEELARPVPGSDWVVKDFISHLATIDRSVGAWFRALAGGSDRPLGRPDGDTRPFNIDEWNDAQVAERRDWNLDRIFKEAQETRLPLVEALSSFTDEQLDRAITFGGDSKRAPRQLTLAQYLIGWAKHDPIHVNDMIRALPEHRNDEDVVAWLDDPTVGPLARGYAAQMGWEEGARSR